jgi:outer membrane protein OmpA-like peptidoglycan-associated protein/Tol biopolymer transport system component
MKKIIILILALAYTSISQPMNITPLEFNSSADDFGSSIIHNGRTLYFSSAKKGKQRIFFSEKIGTGWTLSNETTDALNKGEEVGFPSLSQDGTNMIFSALGHQVKGEGRTDLYSARKIEGEWTEITNLGKIINTRFWESQPCLSRDGSILFFVSDRPEGYGGTDIYYSRKVDGNWEKPKNAGPKINTEFDEMTPVLALDNKQFTFSSNRPKGEGGFDIYHCVFNNKDFTQPKILASPFNSEFDEFYYTLVPKSKSAIFTSNRPLSAGKLDVYTAVVNPIQQEDYELLTGTIFDKTTNESLFGELIFTDISNPENKFIVNSDDRSGSYSTVLDLGKSYLITATKKGYLFQTQIFNSLSESDGKEKSLSFELSPIPKGITKLLVTFEDGNANLLEESNYDLNFAANFLKENSGLNILIMGHTFEPGGEIINDNLSLRRANAVRDYLINAGIDESRIRTKGVGKNKPLSSDLSDEAKALNRRIEMQITSE